MPINRYAIGTLNLGPCIWVIRSCPSMCHEYVTWTAAPRFRYLPIRPCRGHATWTRVYCCGRCQYHKRKNIESYLPKREQSRIGRKLEAAYAKPTYNAAKKALNALKPELELTNQSALHSLEEGMEETLTLHRLGLMSMLGRSFRTTNCIDNVNSLLQQLTHNVRHWKNSAQRYRWVATALLDIEPRLRRIQGYHQLPMLPQAELGTKQLAKAG